MKKELNLNAAVESIAATTCASAWHWIFEKTFDPRKMIVPGQITVINLSDIDLPAQQVVVTALLRRLFFEGQCGNALLLRRNLRSEEVRSCKSRSCIKRRYRRAREGGSEMRS